MFDAAIGHIIFSFLFFMQRVSPILAQKTAAIEQRINSILAA